jgi:hypothetical protein
MKRKALLVLIAWLVLVPGGVRGSAQQSGGPLPQLGAPPTFPQKPVGATLKATEQIELPPPPAGPTALTVNPANREASRAFFNTYYLGAPTPPIDWSGNRATCDAGTTSQAFRDAVLQRVNYFRAMAGVPAQVALSDAYNVPTQQAALMMSANNQLSHSPSPSWQCYTPEGAAAAGKSDLFLGVYGWDAITGYVRDPGDFNGAVGHRRWILYPQTQTMGTGDLPPTGGASSNALWVIDGHIWDPRPATRDMFVAWPPPGYVPYQVVFPRWSFSYPNADFSQASVTMTLNGQQVPLELEAVAAGYGENTLAWAITGMAEWDPWPVPLADTPYRVTIDQVLIGGAPHSFTYDVTVIDPAQASPAPVASDLTGDRKSDVLWRHETRGEVWLWPMNGATRTAENYVRTVSDTNWEIRGLGDQTGDGKADILWRHKITGAIYLWPMNGSTPLSETYVGAVDPAYDIVGTGDFDGDGKSDILWRHATNGEVWIWLMDGATPLSQVYVGMVNPAYVIKGVGDLDGDGKADIVWHHATVGDVWVWLMNGTTRRSATWVGAVPDVNYQIVGVADYTGDGKADILWHHATRGEVWLWRMDGTTRLAETWAGTVPDTNYRIVGCGDYDGDRKADILWRHAALGEVWVWLMDGATRLSETWIGSVSDIGYEIIKSK